MHWTCRVRALAGFLPRSNHKVWVFETLLVVQVGMLSSWRVLAKRLYSATYYPRLSLKIQNLLQPFITKKINKQTNGCGWVCIKLCPILFSPPSSSLARHISRKLLGFQRVTGIPCSQTVNEDLSNCLYSGTHTKITFTIRKYLQRSQELLSICKSAAVDVCVRKDLRK